MDKTPVIGRETTQSSPLHAIFNCVQLQWRSKQNAVDYCTAKFTRCPSQNARGVFTPMGTGVVYTRSFGQVVLPRWSRAPGANDTPAPDEHPLTCRDREPFPPLAFPGSENAQLHSSFLPSSKKCLPPTPNRRNKPHSVFHADAENNAPRTLTSTPPTNRTRFVRVNVGWGLRTRPTSWAQQGAHSPAYLLYHTFLSALTGRKNSSWMCASFSSFVACSVSGGDIFSINWHNGSPPGNFANDVTSTSPEVSSAELPRTGPKYRTRHRFRGKVFCINEGQGSAAGKARRREGKRSRANVYSGRCGEHWHLYVTISLER